MFYVCNSNKCPSKVDHYRIHANPPALGWNTHPDSGGMVYAVKMYSFRQLQCTLSDIHTI